MLTLHLGLGLRSGLFPSDFPIKTLYAFLFFPHIISFSLYKRWSSTLCSYLHSPVTTSHTQMSWQHCSWTPCIRTKCLNHDSTILFLVKVRLQLFIWHFCHSIVTQGDKYIVAISFALSPLNLHHRHVWNCNCSSQNTQHVCSSLCISCILRSCKHQWLDRSWNITTARTAQICDHRFV
jgi:hypothetical protein